MPDLRIETNLPEVSKKVGAVAKRFPNRLDSTVKNAGNQIIGVLKRLTPKQSGLTDKGFVNKRLKLADYEVTNTRKTKDGKIFVSDLLEDGTRAHGPKTFKFLKFKSLGRRPSKRLGIKKKKGTGKFIFTKWVKGIKAFKIFEKTFPKAKRIVRVNVLRMLKLISRRV